MFLLEENRQEKIQKQLLVTEEWSTNFQVHLWQTVQYKRRVNTNKRKLKQERMETWELETAQTYPLRQNKKFGINDKCIRNNSSLLQLHPTAHKGPQLHRNSEHKTLPWLLANLHTEKNCETQKTKSSIIMQIILKSPIVDLIAHTFISLLYLS